MTKIPSVEEQAIKYEKIMSVIKQENEDEYDEDVLELHREAFRDFLTADRLALLTELRESIQTINFYGWNEQTQSMIKKKVQAHLDELIKSNSV